MTISCIVAVGKNNIIGKDNQIPWYLPADLKYFKETTMGHHIIMGRKCFASIGRPLPKRTNIIVTRNIFYTISDAIVTFDLEEALNIAEENGEKEVFIIGGGEIYLQSMPYWDKVYLTEVDVEVPDADVFFPNLDPSEWKLTKTEAHLPDEKNEFAYQFKVFERI